MDAWWAGDAGAWWSIAGGGLLVAIASVLPRLGSTLLSPDRWLVTQAFLAGGLIRITGTVALFLASSYYLDASATWVAGWVLFWHACWLLIEVAVIWRSNRTPAP